MTLFFTAVVVFDGWLDGSVTLSSADDKPIQGTILCILVALLIIPAQLEMSKLLAAKNLKPFTGLSIIASILFSASWYLPQLTSLQLPIYLSLLCAFSLLALLLYQYICCSTSAVIANCGANYFSIIYLGLLSGFVLAVRIDFGLWALLMFVFAVKSSDIGAYAIGSRFGRHKFSPVISPGKTWEGMAGAAAVSMIVAVLFARICDIMAWPMAAVFGLLFALIGQAGDLVESMLKRDAKQKDSANTVPGFGGILDIVDSPLAAAPFAYLFFFMHSSIY